MKILQLCKKFPYPPKDGEMIAIFNITESFVALGHDVTLLALNTNKHYFDPAKLPIAIAKKIQFITVDINTDLDTYDAFKSLITNRAYNIQRFYSQQFTSTLLNLLQQNTYDLILAEGLPLLLYIDTIRKNSKAHLSYRAHNVEYEIWERLAANCPSLLKSLYYKILAAQVKQFERLQIAKVDSIIAISKRDELLLQGLSKVKYSHVSPACIAIDSIKSDNTNSNRDSLFFLGALDWQPNVEGLLWFVNKVFPTILKVLPNTKVHIGGRNMPSIIRNLASINIIIEGEIKEVPKFMNAHQIMIVPLLSGSGMRIKIIESMMYKKSIISTDIGAEGIDDENTIIRCANAATFASETIALLQNKVKQIALGEKAADVATIKYSAMNITSDLLSFYQPIINEK